MDLTEVVSEYKLKIAGVEFWVTEKSLQIQFVLEAASLRMEAKTT